MCDELYNARTSTEKGKDLGLMKTKPKPIESNNKTETKVKTETKTRDCGATLRLGGTVSDSILYACVRVCVCVCVWGGGGGAHDTFSY